MSAAGASAASLAKRGDVAEKFNVLLRRTGDAVLPPAPPSACAVRVDEGKHRGAIVRLRRPPVRIGSADDNDVVLNDHGVQERHADLRWIDGRWAMCVPDSGDPIPPHRSQRRGAFDRETFLVGAARLTLTQRAGASQRARSPVVRLREITAEALPWHRFAAPLFFGLAAVAVLIGAVVVLESQQPPRQWSQRTLAAEGWPDVQAVMDSNGSTLLEGFVATHAELEGLQDWLARQRRGGPADVRVRVGEDVAARVSEQLQGSGVQASYAGAGLVRVMGTSKSKTLSHQIQRVGRDLGSGLAIEDAVDYELAPEPAAMRPLPFRITCVSPGPRGSFCADNGGRYFIGAKMKDGAEVIAVRPHEIEFRLGETRIFYPLK